MFATGALSNALWAVLTSSITKPQRWRWTVHVPDRGVHELQHAGYRSAIASTARQEDSHREARRCVVDVHLRRGAVRLRSLWQSCARPPPYGTTSSTRLGSALSCLRQRT